MTDLTKTFLQCLHCQHHFSEPRNVCPACDWPRSHSDETPPPTWSQPDTSAQPVAPAAQIDLGIINVDAGAPLEPAPEAAPQAAPTILADIPIPQVRRPRQPKTLVLAPEEPVEPTAPEGDAT